MVGPKPNFGRVSIGTKSLRSRLSKTEMGKRARERLKGISKRVWNPTARHRTHGWNYANRKGGEFTWEKRGAELNHALVPNPWWPRFVIDTKEHG